MTTPILNIAEVADGQINQYLTYNEALRSLESAANDFYVVDLSSGNVTLTAGQFTRAVLFKSDGNTVARTLTAPASKRLFIVQNTGTAALTVKIGTTEIAVPIDSGSLFYSDGTANGLLAIAGGGGATADTFAAAAVVANAIDLSEHNAVWIVNLDDDVTAITLPAATTGKALSLIILFTQDVSGGHTVTGWGSVIFESGSEPVIDTTAEAITSVPVLILGNGDKYVVGS